MTPRLALSSALLMVAFLGTVGCVAVPAGGGTSGTSVYVYDNGSGNVLKWNDANVLYGAPSAMTTPDVTISSGSIQIRNPLAWGGLAVDATANCMYIVSATGGVTRINSLSTQTGPITDSSYLTTFTLGTAGVDPYPNGSFGEACVNPNTNTLYVTETGSGRSTCRIWVVPGASSYAQATVPVSSVIASVADDMGFAGVAAGSGSLIYGYFPYGDSIYPGITQSNPQNGGRIRAGSPSFDPLSQTKVLVGTNTELSDSTTTFGSLAYDSINNLLYVSRNADSGAQTPLPAVLVFGTGQFTSGFNQAPNAVLTDTVALAPAGLSNLRFITHAGIKDWLAGADMLGTAGTNNLYLWKSPSVGGASTLVTLPAGIQVAGIALDGSD